MSVTGSKNKRYFRFLTGAFLAILFYCCLSVSSASAAILYLSPSSGTYRTDQTISLGVYVTSSDQAMNAVSVSLSFPVNRLEVLSVSKTGSIVGLWVQEPSFSNIEGTVSFEGIVLNPGFQGTGGKVATVTFRPKAPGAARIFPRNASVLANDGRGTNILTTIEECNLQLNSYVQATPTPAPTVEPSPQNVIRSTTHPNPDNWYNNSNASFVWNLPTGATGVRVGYGQSGSVVPSTLYDPVISEYTANNVRDGIWYFALQIRTEKGWGQIYRFKFRIDTEPPKPFKIKFVDGPETRNPRPVALFEATDELSGIDFYKVKVGDRDFANVSADMASKNPYTLGPLGPGKHIVLVQAYDRAGNYTTDSNEIMILPIDTPVIDEYQKSLRTIDFLMVRGTTHPDALVTVFLQYKSEAPKSFVVSSNSIGKFSFISENHLKEGPYRFWVMVTDKDGAQSLPTDKYLVLVERDYFVYFGDMPVGILTLVIFLVALLLSVAAVTILVSRRSRGSHRAMLAEITGAKTSLHRTLNYLRDIVRHQIGALGDFRTRREMIQEEKRAIEELERNLNQAERFLQKEIQDIEDSLSKK